jgi:tRNA (guanine-N7-)-methyltransferase
MSRRKLNWFAFNEDSKYVVERGKPLFTTIKGRWHQVYFKNDNPIVLELACGKGEYTIGLGKAYPHINYIGIDIKGDRIARGAKLAQAAQLQNVAFLRTDIRYLADFFEPAEIVEIWITFPDPQPRDKQEKHRLTHPSFLAVYQSLLPQNGLLHLKTDSDLLFDYTLSVLTEGKQVWKEEYQVTDLYSVLEHDAHLGIYTKYEQVFFSKGFSIKYLKFSKK